ASGRRLAGHRVGDRWGLARAAAAGSGAPRAPAGAIPRYGIGYKTSIYVGKVINNSGAGTTASVLAGLNWAIANRCAAILTSVGAGTPPQTAYTAAGAAARDRGCGVNPARGPPGGRPAGGAAGAPT